MDSTLINIERILIPLSAAMGVLLATTSLMAVLIRKDREKIESDIQKTKNIVKDNDPDQIQKWLSVLQDISTRYHSQALAQATWQFWISAFGAISGLAMVAVSLAAYLTETDRSGFPFGALPGILVEAISILFFREAKETRERATALLDKSRIDNMREKALEIVNSIDNPELRDAVKTEMALQMTEISSSPVSGIITELLQLNGRER